MAITSLLNSNSNPSLISQRRQFFHDNGNLCCIRSANFNSSSKISGVKLTKFMDSVLSRNNTNKQMVISSATSKRNPEHVAESFESTGQREHGSKKECVSGLRGTVMKFLAIAGLLFRKNADAIFRRTKITVKLQVCFVVGERELKRRLKELERMSKMSILDSLSHEERLQRRAMKFGVASKDLADKVEAIINVLQGLSYYSFSSDASVEVKKSIEDAEDCCKQLSIEEVKKIDDGTLAQFEETYKVTLLVAAEVDSHLPPIYDVPDLRLILNRLQNIIKDDKIHAVELFWAPEDEKHIMSPNDYHSAYPLLKPHLMMNQLFYPREKRF